MGSRFKQVIFGTGYECDYSVVEPNDDHQSLFGYEELHLTDELIEILKSGKAISIPVQDEYELRIIFGDKGE